MTLLYNYITYRDKVNYFLDLFFKYYLKSAEFGCMIMSIGDRFKETREKLGLNQSELARSIGANPSIISDIERGDKEPSKKIISALIVKYRINSNWLLTEQGDMYIKDDLPQKSRLEQDLDETIAAHPKFTEIESRLSALESLLKQEKPAPAAAPGNDGPPYTADPAPEYGEEEEEEREEIPFVHGIAAGPPITMSDERGQTASVPKRMLRDGGQYYAADIRGGSMKEAGIRDGDLVLIRCADTPVNGAIMVVSYRGKSTLKRLRETSKGWELHYEDGSGQVITAASDKYRVQGEFRSILPENTVIRER
jgi:SOS-response transcriptional repressor LexA